jgi:fatty-acyl-CoA synthase
MSSAAQTIDSWLSTHAAHQPNRVALRFEEQSWSYGALSSWVNELAAGLQINHRIGRGDRIAYLGHNSAAQIALFFAAAKLGAIVVPMNWRLAVEELRYIVDDVSPQLLVFGTACEDAAAALGVSSLHEAALPRSADTITPRAALHDPFLIVYTSGTTGRPKGAILTQEAIFWNAVISIHAHDLTASDHVLNILPLFHIGGINIQVLPCLFAGGTVSIHSVFDPQATLHALQEEGITSTVCVPTVMRALMALPDWKDAEFPVMRLMNTGSTDVPVDILQAVNARGLPMIQVYGATETGPIATYQRGREAAATIGSIGRAAAHCQVRIAHPDGRSCAVNEPGEIWVKGPNNFAAYWRNPSATEEAKQDGWFKTGDIGRQDEDGLFWFVSRLKHVIISGGENIYPAEIERIIARLPGVQEVAVVGRAHPHWGEVPVVAAVIAANGPGRTELLAACDSHLARFKRPKDVILLEALPKNALGKVSIEEVRQLVAAQEDA